MTWSFSVAHFGKDKINFSELLESLIQDCFFNFVKLPVLFHAERIWQFVFQDSGSCKHVPLLSGSFVSFSSVPALFDFDSSLSSTLSVGPCPRRKTWLVSFRSPLVPGSSISFTSSHLMPFALPHC